MNKELQNSIQTSTTFNRFKKIPDKAFHDIYFFYQYYSQQISALEFDEYVEIKYNFIQALFHLDKYHLFYKHSNELISELLNYHCFEVKHRIIYEQVLNYKAEALRNESKLKASQSLYSELMRLNSENKLYKRKYFYLQFQSEQIRNRKNIALIVFFIIVSLTCTYASVFIFQPFLPEWAPYVNFSRNTFFILGIAGFIVLQCVQMYSAMQAVKRVENRK
jgi:hypothetical protein